MFSLAMQEQTLSTYVKFIKLIIPIWKTFFPSILKLIGFKFQKNNKRFSTNKPLSKTLIIVNLQHKHNSFKTSAEPEFRLSWMKPCSSDDHYHGARVVITTTPWSHSSNNRYITVCNCIKKRLEHRCFPLNIAKCLGTLIL